MRPSLGRLRVVFSCLPGLQSSISLQAESPPDQLALEAWQTQKMTLNLPKLGFISFHLLSRTQKTVVPKISKICPVGSPASKKICIIFNLRSPHLEKVFDASAGTELQVIKGWTPLLDFQTDGAEGDGHEGVDTGRHLEVTNDRTCSFFLDQRISFLIFTMTPMTRPNYLTQSSHTHELCKKQNHLTLKAIVRHIYIHTL